MTGFDRHGGSALHVPTTQAGRTSAGLWYPLSLPLKFVIYGGVWVGFQYGLKLSCICASSGASQEMQTSVSHCLVLPSAIGHELQSNLQMAGYLS